MGWGKGGREGSDEIRLEHVRPGEKEEKKRSSPNEEMHSGHARKNWKHFLSRKFYPYLLKLSSLSQSTS